MQSIGIDIGSMTTKIAVMDNRTILYADVSNTGYDAAKAWQTAFAKAIEALHLTEGSIRRVVSTGYGRNSVHIAAKKVTEIMCHAEGARYFRPDMQSVIDIGGQDSKFIRIGQDGKVADFVMNDKCAAGTGRFLEVMARALELNLEDFGQLAMTARKPAKISSMCTVFAESEVVSLVSKGESRANIVAGIHESIASRIVSMMGRAGAAKPVVLTGGVARNAGIQKAIENRLNMKISVPSTAQVNGAIGAALLAQKL